jgi:hypothetical protein
VEEDNEDVDVVVLWLESVPVLPVKLMLAESLVDDGFDVPLPLEPVLLLRFVLVVPVDDLVLDTIVVDDDDEVEDEDEDDDEEDANETGPDEQFKFGQ